MASRAETEALDIALVEIVAAESPITVRGVFYRAVARGLVPKEETTGYRKVQRRLLKLREDYTIPYGWIVDGSRTVYGYTRYRNAEEFASTVQARYRQDYWAESDEYVQVWIEKDAMSGVVRQVTDEFGLDLYVTRGFASVTYLQNAAEDISVEDRPVYVYLLTDYYPSGMNIADKVEEELFERSGYADVGVRRLAVTPEQIEAWNLPTRPTKRPRRSLTHYERSHSAASVELDAVPPDTLRSLLRSTIEQHMDQWKLAQMKMVEQEERE